MALDYTDYEEIRQLLYKFSWALDWGEVESMRPLVTDDVVLTTEGMPRGAERHSGELRGPEGFVAFAESVFGGCRGLTKHINTNQIIDGDGDRATMKSYVSVFRAGVVPEAGIILTGAWFDDLVKVDGVWKFAKRHVIADPVREFGTDTPDVMIVARERVVGGIDRDRLFAEYR
ncbi:nuclear transport factor 2 family protein [Arthrobacter sp. KNU-44]|uniref:nuclear transport factor 2 family protein n=1 Tax=Arthrobacter sp. KNU-44 TaxID=3450744 RepID=UPI003F41CA7F